MQTVTKVPFRLLLWTIKDAPSKRSCPEREIVFLREAKYTSIRAMRLDQQSRNSCLQKDEDGFFFKMHKYSHWSFDVHCRHWKDFVISCHTFIGLNTVNTAEAEMYQNDFWTNMNGRIFAKIKIRKEKCSKYFPTVRLIHRYKVWFES